MHPLSSPLPAHKPQQGSPMALHRKVAVIGSAIGAPLDRPDRSLEELIYEATQKALADAGFDMAAIDGIVVAANDQLDGRAISVMMASGSVGGVDRDILSTPSAGEHAFVMGALRVASGQYRTQLVVAWSPVEAHSIPEVERLAADPYFHRRLPQDDLASYALQATALAGKVEGVHELARSLAALRPAATAGSESTPGRWPLTAEMVAPPATGVVAIVLADEDFVAEHAIAQPAWVRGMGWATEPGFLGDRDLAGAPALEAATGQAYAEAAIDDPGAAFDVAEIDDRTPYQELLVLEGLGLSSRHDWQKDVAAGAFAPGGRLPVNPSGGTRAANAIYCTGLMRIAEAAAQIRGKAANQIVGARTALAHAASGAAMQYQTVIVLGQDR